MAIKMANEKIEAKVLAAEKSFYEDLEAAKKNSTTTKPTTTTTHYIVPFHDTTKYYWATVIWFSLMAIPGIYCFFAYDSVDEHVAVPMVCYTLMWLIFCTLEMMRYIFGRNHTSRAVCFGAAILTSQLIAVTAIAYLREE